MKTRFFVGASVLVGLSCAQSGREVGSRQATVISDENHSGGRQGFAYLPPLVEAFEASGAFDPTRTASVEIRDVASGGLVASFGMGGGSGSIRVNELDGEYVVNWDTQSSSLDASRLYRITVLAAGEVYGWADVDPVDSGRELRSASTNELIPLLNGRTLPIKFRFSVAACGGGCDDGDATTIDRCNPDSSGCMHTTVPCGTAPGCVVRVPADVATIQQAVDAVADDGVVLVAPGTYAGSVSISGKRVTVVGDWGGGSQRAELVVPRSVRYPGFAGALTVVDFALRGGGRLENLRLTGGDVGVRGRDGAGAVDIEAVTLQGHVHGIAGAWQQLGLKDSAILDSLATAYVTGCGGDQTIADSLIQNAGGSGIHVIACGSTPISVTVDSTILWGNAVGGALFVGNGGNLLAAVTASVLANNHAFGIWFHNVTPVTPGVNPALVVDTGVTDTLPGDVGTFTDLAHGIIASDSSVFLLGSEFVNSGTAGGVFSDTDLSILGNQFGGDRYGLVVQGTTGLTYHDLGGNVMQGGELDLLWDGSLPVPEPPAALP